MTDLETLSALFKARGIDFEVEHNENFGTLINTAPKQHPSSANYDLTDEQYEAAMDAYDAKPGYDHFYAVFQFDEDGKLLHIGAYE